MIKQEVVSLLKSAGIDANIETLEVPPKEDMGDVSFPCFGLAKVKKTNPAIIASEIRAKLQIPKSSLVERVEAVGGYVNFFANNKKIAEETLKTIIQQGNDYGKSIRSNEKVMIEFSQANTHKAFHVGHIRGTSLGESIARIFEFCGDKVTRVNYQGDKGMHVAKWIWCYKNFHKREEPKRDEAWVASIYVEAVRKLEEHPELQKEVDDINKDLEEGKDKRLVKIWQDTRRLSLSSFEKIYKELNTHFDNYFFESQMDKRGKQLVQELIKYNIAKVSDGAVIVDLENHGLGVWVLLRKDGTVLYSAKDLALAEKKFKDFKIDKAVYVVGNEQRLHFMQLFKTLELMDFKESSKCHYVPVSEIRLPTGKMSSRTGNNVLYSDFKKEITDFAADQLKQRYKLKAAELKSRALAIAIASIKYSMLKQDTNKTIVFDKEEALRFEGDTGPYLLYGYARAKSILKKAKYNPNKKFEVGQITDLEKSLISHLRNFPDVVFQSFNNLAPNVVANYAYKLVQVFNEFYHESHVIGSKDEKFMLVLVDCFTQTLKNALHLLGVNVIEKM